MQMNEKVSKLFKISKNNENERCFKYFHSLIIMIIS